MTYQQKTEFVEKEKIVLTGAAYWAFVHAPQPDPRYGDKYKIDLVVEDENGVPYTYNNPVTGVEEDMVKKLTEMGVELQTHPTYPGRYVRIKSKSEFVNKKEGRVVKRGPIPVADALKNPIGPETLIGNGSLVRVQALKNEWSGGVSLLLDRVIVDKLIPYVPKGAEFDFPHMRGGAKKEHLSSTNDESDVPFEE